MTLQFQIIVFTKHAVKPLHSLAGTSHVAVKNLLGHLTCNTGRTDYQALVVTLQVLTVGTRTHIIAVNP